MRKIMLKLWADDRGALLSAEWVFMATILVIGAAAGLATVKTSVDAELGEIAHTMTSLNQSYYVPGVGNNQDLGGSSSIASVGSSGLNNSGRASVNSLNTYGAPRPVTVDQHLLDRND